MKNLIPLIDSTMQFWTPHANAVHRKTVIMVIYDPSIGEYFYCDRPEYGLCCNVSGWVEDWESYEGALHREIKEETGFYDYTVIWRLWWRILTHYFMSKKHEFRVKDIESYLIFVDSSKKNPSAMEDDEVFNIKSINYHNLLALMMGYHNPNWWWLEDHMEILNRAYQYIASHYANGK